MSGCADANSKMDGTENLCMAVYGRKAEIKDLKEDFRFEVQAAVAESRRAGERRTRNEQM